MSPRPKRVLAGGLAVLLAGAGCAGVEVRVHEGPEAPRTLAGRLAGHLAVARAVLLERVPGAAPGGPFAAGIAVGNLYLSGGYVIEKTELGIEYRSKHVAVNARADYARQARRWLDRAVHRALAARGLRAAWTGVIDPSALPVPEQWLTRGSDHDDPQDDVNLPRFVLRPKPLDAAHRARLPALPRSVHWLLVPVVVDYYSHNAGWFIGQTLGCGAGARLRAFWVLYDVRSGAAASYGGIEAKRIDPNLFSPNRGQTEDLLIAVEKAGAAAVERRLLR